MAASFGLEIIENPPVFPSGSTLAPEPSFLWITWIGPGGDSFDSSRSSNGKALMAVI
jgi:hypothetical protein